MQVPAIPASALTKLANERLLVDTNFLVDAMLYSDEFEAVLGQLQAINCTLVTIQAVRLEFISSTKSIFDFQKKRDILRRLILSYITVESNDIGGDNGFLYVFGRQAHKFDPTDYLLAKALHDDPSLSLLTANHRDMTARLFHISEVMNVVVTDCVKTYQICQINEEKLKQSLAMAIRDFKAQNKPSQ